MCMCIESGTFYSHTVPEPAITLFSEVPTGAWNVGTLDRGPPKVAELSPFIMDVMVRLLLVPLKNEGPCNDTKC